MTGLQDRLLTLTDQSQDALAAASRAWSHSAQRLSSPTGMSPAAPEAVVDLVFDLAEQVLATQRALTKALLRALVP